MMSVLNCFDEGDEGTMCVRAMNCDNGLVVSRRQWVVGTCSQWCLSAKEVVRRFKREGQTVTISGESRLRYRAKSKVRYLMTSRASFHLAVSVQVR